MDGGLGFTIILGTIFLVLAILAVRDHLKYPK